MNENSGLRALLVASSISGPARHPGGRTRLRPAASDACLPFPAIRFLAARAPRNRLRRRRRPAGRRSVILGGPPSPIVRTRCPIDAIALTTCQIYPKSLDSHPQAWCAQKSCSSTAPSTPPSMRRSTESPSPSGPRNLALIASGCRRFDRARTNSLLEGRP